MSTKERLVLSFYALHTCLIVVNCYDALIELMTWWYDM